MNELLKNTRIIEAIIKELPDTFSSHEFIQKFSQRLQKEYLAVLTQYTDNNQAFKTVHGQIARYLSTNHEEFGIKKLEKVNSANIFGDVVEIQNWQKVK